MKAIYLVMGFVFLAFTSSAQETGIQFEQNASWQEVLSKAKEQQKYIFVDCYATWCGPCKEMDKNIYASPQAGDYFNRQFINLKVQMDSTGHDDTRQRGWYKDAQYLMDTYEVRAFPTYLFFSPDGKIVHKSTGYQDIDRFIATAKDALNPEHQYYTLLGRYNNQQLDNEDFIPLALMAKQLGNIKLSKELADKFVKTVSSEDLFTPDNIEALEILVQNSQDKSFIFFLKNTEKINKVMDKPTYANGVIDRIVMKEEIDNRLFPANRIPERITSAEWNNVYNSIAKKYGKSYAERLVTNKKAGWFRHKKEWEDFAREMVHFFDLTNGINLNGFALNNNAWAVFQYTSNKTYLNKAAYWMKKLIDKDSTDYAGMDTYANLLYKSGQLKEAIKWQEKAVDLTKREDKDLIKNLEKMKRGEPTWPKPD